MTPFELFFALRFSPAIDAVYIDTRDSVKVYLTYRDGRTYFYETDRPNGRRWRTLTCHEARDGRWPQQFGLENPTTPGRQQRRALRDDTLLAVTEEALAPTD